MREKDSPLGAFRVLDLTQMLAGPHCTQMLADLGADVVKVERPGQGDDLRNTVAYAGRGGHQDYFNANNRSKRSIALDLKDNGDRKIAHSLARVADIVVENFAPGTAARLGMGWDALRDQPEAGLLFDLRLRPERPASRLAGARSGHPGHHRGEERHRRHRWSGGADRRAAGQCHRRHLSGLCHPRRAAWRAQQRHWPFDLSMQDAILASLGPRMGEILQAGALPMRVANENPQRAPGNSYATSDRSDIAIICLNDGFWPPICRAMECEALIDDARFVDMARRVENREALNAIIGEIFSRRTADAWRVRLEAERVPYAMVNDYAQALDDAQIAHRGLIRELDHPYSGTIRVVGPPWTMTGQQADATPPPLLGQHGEEVLAEWLDAPTEN